MQRLSFLVRVRNSRGVLPLEELPPNGKLKHEILLAHPTRPAWCKDCGALAPAEDIASTAKPEVRRPRVAKTSVSLQSGSLLIWPTTSEEAALKQNTNPYL
jgi:hypothetical protein